MLLVLGFDVYKQPPEATLAIAKKEGFMRGSFMKTPGKGSRHVFGAEKGDLKSKQFWVEKDRMLFVRARPDRSPTRRRIFGSPITANSAAGGSPPWWKSHVDAKKFSARNAWKSTAT